MAGPRNQHGLTSRQEEFCQLLARGASLCDAYEASYEATGMSKNSIYRESCVISKRPKITQRIEFLRAQLWESRGIDASWVKGRAIECFEQAKAAGAWTACSRFLAMIGAEVGVFIPKKEFRTRLEVVNYADILEELRRRREQKVIGAKVERAHENHVKGLEGPESRELDEGATRNCDAPARACQRNVRDPADASAP